MVLPRIPALLIQCCKDDSSLMHKRVGQRAQIVTEADAVRSENRVGLAWPRAPVFGLAEIKRLEEKSDMLASLVYSGG